MYQERVKRTGFNYSQFNLRRYGSTGFLRQASFDRLRTGSTNGFGWLANYERLF
jgi:hypothetical protein